MPDANVAARPETRMRFALPLRLARIEWYSLAFGLLVAHAFLAHEWRYPSSYDAGLYAKMGREIVEQGLFHRYSASDLRTYGYPLFLSVVHRLADASRLPFVAVLFETQLALFFGACLFFRDALSRVSPVAARIAFCATVANYYVLIYLPESLTESASITLLLVVAACWLRIRTGLASGLLAGTLAAGFAAMVRPANLFIVVAWIAGLAIIAIRRRPSLARTLAIGALIVAGLAIPAIPQLVNNVVLYGKRTPLVVEDLGHMQLIWGVRDIKYATGMPPVPVAAIHYVNPMWRGTSPSERSPWRWYVENGWRGPLTLALHIFGLTDQDLLFTYSRDLDPWYRLPLGVVNHAMVALGLYGSWLMWRKLRYAPTAPRDALLLLGVLIAANLAAYAWTAVEMRFGSVVLLVLAPLACHAGIRLAGASPRIRAVGVTSVVAYVTLALVLSGWVRDQSDVIRALHAAGTP